MADSARHTPHAIPRRRHHPHRLRPRSLHRRSDSDPRPQPACVDDARARDPRQRPRRRRRRRKIQHSFAYSDGFGREIQKKVQAEPGPAASTGGADVVDPALGRQRLDDLQQQGQAGPPVRAVLHAPPTGSSSAIAVGVSPMLFYDPRRARRRHAAPQPHLGEGGLRSVGDRDMGRQRHRPRCDPRADADVADYFRGTSRAPRTCRPGTRRAGRRSSGARSRPRRRRRRRTRDTPATAHLDTLGRTFLTVAHNGFSRRRELESTTHCALSLDIEGNPA